MTGMRRPPLRLLLLLLALVAAIALLVIRFPSGTPAQSARPATPMTAGARVRLAPTVRVPGVPVALIPLPDESWLIATQDGHVRRYHKGALGPYLDLTARTRAQGEQGLLGLALAPGFTTRGRVLASYTNVHGDTEVMSYPANMQRAVARDGVRVFRAAQPYDNHNGGHIIFGPDGMLYLGLGDGGSGGDPEDRAQRLDDVLGKIVRLDVRTPGATRIPRDNPFVRTPGARGEIAHRGLRNPWRFSFAPDRTLWIGDVGQGKWEEISRTHQLGRNFGWSAREGYAPYEPDRTRGSLTPPVAVYAHEQERCSVTGGYVYRGTRIPALRGHYVFGDYCTGEIFSLPPASGRIQRLRVQGAAGRIVSFAEDRAGEIYVLSDDGRIQRLVAA